MIKEKDLYNLYSSYILQLFEKNPQADPFTVKKRLEKSLIAQLPYNLHNIERAKDMASKIVVNSMILAYGKVDISKVE